MLLTPRQLNFLHVLAHQVDVEVDVCFASVLRRQWTPFKFTRVNTVIIYQTVDDLIERFWCFVASDHEMVRRSLP